MCLSALLSSFSWDFVVRASSRDTHTPPVSVVVKLHPSRFKMQGQVWVPYWTASYKVYMALVGFHSFCWGPTAKSTAFMLQCLFGGVGAGQVCRDRREEALHCPGERQAPGEGTPAALLTWGDSGPVESHRPSPGYHPFPWHLRIGHQDTRISVLRRTNQSIAGLWVCFSLCQKCRPPFLSPSGQLLSPALSPVVLCSLSWCWSLLPPAWPLRLRLALWDKAPDVPRESRHLMNAWIKGEMQRKPGHPGNRHWWSDGTCRFLSPFQESRKSNSFHYNIKQGPANFFWKRSDKYFRLCRSLGLCHKHSTFIGWQQP